MSLTLDMCSPGCTEPYGYGAQLSPKDQSAKEYLREGTHTLTPAQLHTRAMDDQSLQAEFYVNGPHTHTHAWMLTHTHPRQISTPIHSYTQVNTASRHTSN